MRITLQTPGKDRIQHLSLESLTNQMKHGKYLKNIERYQQWLQSENRFSLRPKYVDSIPTFCLNEVDADGHLLSYNGMVHLYLRNLPSYEEVAQVFQQVSASRRTLLAYRGLSGRSVHVICQYALPESTPTALSLPSQPEMAVLFHAHAYNDARKYYQRLLKQPLHFQEARLDQWNRFTIDETLHYCPDAECIPLEQPLTLPGTQPGYVETLSQRADPIQALRPSDRRNRILSDLFDNCLAETLNEHSRPEREEDWHEFLSALARRCYHSGIPEADCVHWIVVTLNLYRQKNSVNNQVHNLYAFEQGGFGLHPCLTKEQKMAWQLKDFVSRRYELRYNELKQSVEYVDLYSSDTHFSTVDDRVVNDICWAAHEAGISVWDKDVRRLIGSHFARSFNPLLDYVVMTPTWDGEDHIGNLARRIPTSHPQWVGLFRRWFLSLVAHWIGMDREHANSVTPQLLGGPGERKSTFCRMIMPPELREYYTDHLDLSSLKSATRMLGRFGLINIDEFDQIAATKQAFLKNFLQMPDVKGNAPYRSQVQTFRRYASFIATSNLRDVLTDPSGSRRYLCVEVTGQIDTSPIHYDQLYAHAYRLLRNGEQYWFTKEEEEVIRLQNKRFEHSPSEEELFCSLFRAAAAGEACEELRAAELLVEVQQHYNVRFGKRVQDSFCRRLSKLNIPLVHRVNGNHYRVVRLSSTHHPKTPLL